MMVTFENDFKYHHLLDMIILILMLPAIAAYS